MSAAPLEHAPKGARMMRAEPKDAAAFAALSIPWDLRPIREPADNNSLFRTFSSKYLWWKLLYALRMTAVAMLPIAALIAAPATSSGFVSKAFATSGALITALGTLGESLNAAWAWLKAIPLTVPLLTLFVYVDLYDSPYAWGAVYCVMMALTAFLCEGLTKRLAILVSSVAMVGQLHARYDGKGLGTDLVFPSRLAAEYTMGCVTGVLCTLIPWPRLASRRADAKLEEAARNIALSFAGLCDTFWAPSNMQRRINMVRIQLAKRSALTSLQDARACLDVCRFEPQTHERYYLRIAKSDLLGSFSTLIDSALRLLEAIADDPSLINEYASAEAFGQYLRPPLVELAASVDGALFVIARAESLRDLSVCIGGGATSAEFYAVGAGITDGIGTEGPPSAMQRLRSAVSAMEAAYARSRRDLYYRSADGAAAHPTAAAGAPPPPPSHHHDGFAASVFGPSPTSTPTYVPRGGGGLLHGGGVGFAESSFKCPLRTPAANHPPAFGFPTAETAEAEARQRSVVIDNNNSSTNTHHSHVRRRRGSTAGRSANHGPYFRAHVAPFETGGRPSPSAPLSAAALQAASTIGLHGHVGGGGKGLFDASTAGSPVTATAFSADDFGMSAPAQDFASLMSFYMFTLSLFATQALRFPKMAQSRVDKSGHWAVSFLVCDVWGSFSTSMLYFRDFLAFIFPCEILTDCSRSRIAVGPARSAFAAMKMREALKVSVAMGLSVLFYYYTDRKYAFAGGPSIIAFVVANTSSEALSGSLIRMFGTLFGGVVGFFCARLTNTAEEKVGALMALMFVCGFFRTGKQYGTAAVYACFVIVPMLQPNVGSDEAISRIMQITFAAIIYSAISALVLPARPQEELQRARSACVLALSHALRCVAGGVAAPFPPPLLMPPPPPMLPPPEALSRGLPPPPLLATGVSALDNCPVHPLLPSHTNAIYGGADTPLPLPMPGSSSRSSSSSSSCSLSSHDSDLSDEEGPTEGGIGVGGRALLPAEGLWEAEEETWDTNAAAAATAAALDAEDAAAAAQRSPQPASVGTTVVTIGDAGSPADPQQQGRRNSVAGALSNVISAHQRVAATAALHQQQQQQQQQQTVPEPLFMRRHAATVATVSRADTRDDKTLAGMRTDPLIAAAEAAAVALDGALHKAADWMPFAETEPTLTRIPYPTTLSRDVHTSLLKLRSLADLMIEALKAVRLRTSSPSPLFAAVVADLRPASVSVAALFSEVVDMIVVSLTRRHAGLASALVATSLRFEEECVALHRTKAVGFQQIVRVGRMITRVIRQWRERERVGIAARRAARRRERRAARLEAREADRMKVGGGTLRGDIQLWSGLMTASSPPAAASPSAAEGDSAAPPCPHPGMLSSASASPLHPKPSDESGGLGSGRRGSAAPPSVFAVHHPPDGAGPHIGSEPAAFSGAVEEDDCGVDRAERRRQKAARLSPIELTAQRLEADGEAAEAFSDLVMKDFSDGRFPGPVWRWTDDQLRALAFAIVKEVAGPPLCPCGPTAASPSPSHPVAGAGVNSNVDHATASRSTLPPHPPPPPPSSSAATAAAHAHVPLTSIAEADGGCDDGDCPACDNPPSGPGALLFVTAAPNGNPNASLASPSHPTAVATTHQYLPAVAALGTADASAGSEAATHSKQHGTPQQALPTATPSASTSPQPPLPSPAPAATSAAAAAAAVRGLALVSASSAVASFCTADADLLAALAARVQAAEAAAQTGNGPLAADNTAAAAAGPNMNGVSNASWAYVYGRSSFAAPPPAGSFQQQQPAVSDASHSLSAAAVAAATDGPSAAAPLPRRRLRLLMSNNDALGMHTLTLSLVIFAKEVKRLATSVEGLQQHMLSGP